MPISVALLLLAASPLAPDDSPKTAAAPLAQVPAIPSFRLAVRQYEADRRPVAWGQIVGSRGRIYYLETNNNEIVVIDPAERSIHLIDVKMNIASDVTYRDIDAGLTEHRDDQRKIIEAHAKGKSRGERIDAEMRRDQVEPRFQPRFDDATHTLQMGNTSVQVEARGEPDDDPARLAAIVEAVTTLTKLQTYREPDDLRHLVQLETITTLLGGRKLRPAELTYLFRLAGPPEKHRQTYQLIADVTAEDREGLDLIDAQLPKARRVPFERYNRRIDPDELKR